MPPLTALQVKNLQPAERTKKYYDAHGLFIEVTPQGSKRWRFRYKFAGKNKLLSMGLYPTISYADAKKRRDAALRLLADGRDPSAERKANKISSNKHVWTFAAIAEEWLTEVHQNNVVASHYARDKRRIEQYIQPALGSRDITSIGPTELLEVLKSAIQMAAKAPKAGDGKETGKRIRSLVKRIFGYATITGRATSNPARDLVDVMPTPKKRHHPALTKHEEVIPFMRDVYGLHDKPDIRESLLMSAFLFPRPGEVRTMQWKDIDLENAVWHYQPSKNGMEVLTPLPRQAVEILRSRQLISQGNAHVFPDRGKKNRPLSPNTVGRALRDMGYRGKMTQHGFRAMARTMLEEHLDQDRRHIEMQLAHSVPDETGRAYNRTTWLDQRKQMLQLWADYLESIGSDQQENAA